MDKFVHIYEVGPRDGLQNEKVIIPTVQKIALINALSKLGFKRIEATAFVSAKWVPQMADASEVLTNIIREPDVVYGALVPNMIGFEKALEAKADEVAIFAAASETFSQKNINCSIAESLQRFAPIIDAAKKRNIRVRGYVSCVAGCPYEGHIAPKAVADLTAQMFEMGCYEISLGDTIGIGTPLTIEAMLASVLECVPSKNLAGHYHDTNGQALTNVKVSLDMGLRSFDSAIGGLGGCPYAPGAKGNVSTSALANMLLNEGWQTGIDLEGLEKVEIMMGNIMHELEGGIDV
ncbi:hydroxymethylglutaryl-CoA lyase [Lentilitoribacter sp. EG35]|uniref:hydroxymethylglutaryl-CoA lyase n=1 Tax=Lentilitoribacter sp. EG35 TaxID=3234192 RepID=UPI00345F534A